MIKAIFEKWKEYKRKWVENCKLYDILVYAAKHDSVNFIGIEQVPDSDVFIMKKSVKEYSNLMLMVRKSSWKNYIAITKTYAEDSWGNVISYNDYFTVSNDEKRIISSKAFQDIPKEIIQEFHKELIENSTAIKETIDRKMREEYYN